MTGTANSATGGERSISRSSIGLRSERDPILLPLMLGTSLVALDSTIIANAVPAILALPFRPGHRQEEQPAEAR